MHAGRDAIAQRPRHDRTRTQIHLNARRRSLTNRIRIEPKRPSLTSLVDFDHRQNNKIVPNLTVGYDFHVCHFESS